MPMGAPPVADERDGLLAYLSQQRQGLRLAAYGLSDEQARRTTTASSLSVGGLIKHVSSSEKGWIDLVAGGNQDSFGDFARYMEGFRLGEDETLEQVLAVYDDVAKRTESVIATIADLGREVPVPTNAPWFPDDVEAWSVRWVLLHLIEETALHAGHADIVRECLDGATAGPLLAAAEGWEPTEWMKPWQTEPELSRATQAS